MSTTRELRIAMQYSTSPSSLIFKIRTSSFMQRGADLQFLSTFPGEVELLFPPLTYLRPTGTQAAPLEREDKDGNKFTIIEVEPFLPSNA